MSPEELRKLADSVNNKEKIEEYIEEIERQIEKRANDGKYFITFNEERLSDEDNWIRKPYLRKTIIRRFEEKGFDVRYRKGFFGAVIISW